MLGKKLMTWQLSLLPTSHETLTSTILLVANKLVSLYHESSPPRCSYKVTKRGQKSSFHRKKKVRRSAFGRNKVQHI